MAYKPEERCARGCDADAAGAAESGYMLAVISNREKPYQQEIEELGLAPFFVLALAGGEIKALEAGAGYLPACLRAAEREPHGDGLCGG